MKLMQQFMLIGMKWKVGALNFPMYWTEIHFLMRNMVYVYKEEDLTSKDLYQKKQHISFIDDLGYLGGNIPQDEAGQKCLKHLIDIQLLMEVHSREGMTVFLVSSERSENNCNYVQIT